MLPNPALPGILPEISEKIFELMSDQGIGSDIFLYVEDNGAFRLET
jgi:hypothetical protein